MKQSVLLILCALVFGAAPYPQSEYIIDITWDWTSHERAASGSDNFAVTWADDDAQYLAWGDGWGFHSNLLSGTKISLGVSRMTGAFESYSTQDLWGIPTSGQGGKSYGIISVDGVLYMWYGPGSNTTSYSWTKLKRSADYGQTWTDASWQYDKSTDLIMPTICNFGKDYDGARDNYVYSYFIRLQGNPSSLNVHKPGMIDLARVPEDQIMTQGAYEWVTGFDNSGNPQWGSDYGDRVPVFEDPDGVGWCFSVIYNAGLGRYILVTEHGTTMNANLGFFEAPEPWGPWKTVKYYTYWGSGSGISDVRNTFFANFSNKWTSTDGKNSVLIFTGTGAMDSYNAIKAEFTLASTKAEFRPEVKSGISIRAFPNPFSSRVSISLSEPGRRFDLNIYDISGRQVFSCKGSHAGITWPGTGLPGGLYCAKIILSGKILSCPLLLTR